MKDPYTIFGSSLVSGQWPSTVAKDASSAAASDGTPFCADLINDLWGWKKNIMNLAGLTPNGSSDDYSSSQIVTAIRRAGMHPGQFILSALNSTYLALCRFLPLTGQALLISSYQDLVNATYVGDTYNSAASAFFKCTAASVASTSGAYFKLPDCRGLFPRGLGTNVSKLMATGVGFFGGTYPGDYLPDMGQGHWHTVGTDVTSTLCGDNTNVGTTYGTFRQGNMANSTAARALVSITDGNNGTPRIGPETRCLFRPKLPPFRAMVATRQF